MRLYALTELHDPEAIELFITEEDARRALEDCLRDEPDWRGLLRVEAIEFTATSTALTEQHFGKRGRRTGRGGGSRKAAPGAPPAYCRLERLAMWTRRTRAGSPSESSGALTSSDASSSMPLPSKRAAKRSDCRNHRTASPFADSGGRSAAQSAGPVRRPKVCAPSKNVSITSVRE
jgi:hypothetical protein